MVKDGLHTEDVVGQIRPILSKKDKPNYPSSYIVGQFRPTLYCITGTAGSAYFRYKMAKMQAEYGVGRVLVGEFEGEG